MENLDLLNKDVIVKVCDKIFKSKIYAVGNDYLIVEANDDYKLSWSKNDIYAGFVWSTESVDNKKFRKVLRKEVSFEEDEDKMAESKVLTEKWYIQFWRGDIAECPNKKYFVISKNNEPYAGKYCGMTNEAPFHTFADVWQFHAKGHWKDVTEAILKASNLPEEWNDDILKSDFVLVIDEKGKEVDPKKVLKTPNKDKVEKKKMSSDSESATFLAKQKDRAQAGFYRSACNTGVSSAKAAVLMIMKNQGMSDDKLGAIKEALDNQVLDSLIRLGLGLGLEHAPMLRDNEKLNKVAEELQISGYANGMDEATKLVQQYLLPVAGDILKSFPAEMLGEETTVTDTRSRIEHKDTVSAIDSALAEEMNSAEEEEEKEAEAKKRATA